MAAQIPGPPQWDIGSYTVHFDHAAETGARAVFVSVKWSDVETAPGQYDFSGLDGVVTAAHDRHLDLVLQLQTTGEWSVPTPALDLASGGRRVNSDHPLPFLLTAAPTNIDAAIPFWRAVASRYEPGGALAAQLGWHDGWGVTSYEVENEPDFSPWPGGGWESVPKDYALYVRDVKRALETVDPSLQVVGPALSGNDNNTSTPTPDTGLTWLHMVLSTDPATLRWASDDYRAAVAAGQPIVGAGPYLDIYSFHCDFANGATGALAARADAVRQTIVELASQPLDPTTTHPRLMCSEGAATAYDSSQDNQKYRFAWAQLQFAAELLGAGVERFNYDLGIEGGDTGATWQADPIRPATEALTTAFPSGQGVTSIGAALSQSAGQPVEGYHWSNPNTRLVDSIIWAPNEPLGSGTTGTPFTVQLPVATAKAIVIDPNDWSRHTVEAKHGVVTVTLQEADPSAPWIIMETK